MSSVQPTAERPLEGGVYSGELQGGETARGTSGLTTLHVEPPNTTTECSKTTDQRLYEARRKILLAANETLGALGEEMIAVTSGETGARSTWDVLAVPATELPVPELPDDLIGAERVTRVKDARGDNFVAWFPRR